MDKSDNNLIRFFHRHLVPIFITLESDSDMQNSVLTAFLMSVRDSWYLITAGHIIKKIETLTSQYNYQVSNCVLIDSLGAGAKFPHPIPFDYENSNPTCISDKRDFDYGFIELRQYYIGLLEKNNVEPLNEEVWKKRPDKIDFYLLFGVPGETVNVMPSSVEFAPTIFSVDYLPEQPEGFSETPIPQFYGKINVDEIKSIEGVSGGPIFGFYRNNYDEMRYWVVALQSSWLSKSRIISAAPTFILGDVIEKEFVK
jgi:hypothetical protein